MVIVLYRICSGSVSLQELRQDNLREEKKKEKKKGGERHGGVLDAAAGLETSPSPLDSRVSNCCMCSV